MLVFELVIESFLSIVKAYSLAMRSVPNYLQTRLHGDRSDVRNFHKGYIASIKAIIYSSKAIFYGFVALAAWMVLPLILLCVVISIVFSPNLIIDIISSLVSNIVTLSEIAAVVLTAITSLWLIGDILIFLYREARHALSTSTNTGSNSATQSSSTTSRSRNTSSRSRSTTNSRTSSKNEHSNKSKTMTTFRVDTIENATDPDIELPTGDFHEMETDEYGQLKS